MGSVGRLRDVSGRRRRLADHRLDRQTVGTGEFPVALVVRRHRHHRAGAVAHQHEVGGPHRHALAGERMQRVHAQWHALFLLGFQGRRRYPALRGLGAEFGDLGVTRRGGLGQRVGGRHCQIGHPVQGVRAGGVDRQGVAALGQREVDFQAFRAPDPVLLHGAYRIRPAMQLFQVGEQFVGVVGDLQEPLRNLALLDQRAGAPAAAIHHLLVGQHGLIHRVPVHHRVLAVDQALFQQLQEQPLLPSVIVRPAGGQLARPVIGKAQPLQLAAHVVDVRFGPFRGRHALLDRRVLGRQTEGVPAHGLQHIAPAHALVAGDHVADAVVAHMTHVQPAAGVREHAQAVELVLIGRLADRKAIMLRPVLLGCGFYG